MTTLIIAEEVVAIMNDSKQQQIEGEPTEYQMRKVNLKPI